MIRPAGMVAACALLSVLVSGSARPPDGDAEILWDTWGIPHIHADDDEALFRGFGWAQASSHADLLLSEYAISSGRAAELWGAPHAASDRWVRTLGIPRRAAEWYAAQTSEERRQLDAFAAGINAWVEANPERVADSVRGVAPVTGADVLAHLQRIVHFTFVRAPFDAAGRVGPGSVAGSNAWAIAPSRSASGNAMLLANPHLTWGGPLTFFEAQLVAPGVDLYGATLVGTPFLAIAFNHRLGWTHTVNPLDGADLYALTPAENGGYRWGEDVRPFDTRVDTIRIRQPDGTVRAEPFPVRSSVHGPVVAERDGQPFALRVVGLDQPHMMGQYWEMARATDREAFERALSRLQMPFFNVVYADRDGHVLYVFHGRMPERPGRDWSFWAGVVPGDDPSLLWDRTLAYDALPRVADPPSGWLQNANDPPWTATLPRELDPAAYPPYLAPGGMAFRPQRSASMLAADSSITFDELVEDKFSTRMELAERWLDDLLPLARGAGDPDLTRAAEVLEAWDRSADADSRGAVLFASFIRELAARMPGLAGAFAEPWDPARPLETPDGLARPDMALDALAEAAFNVRQRHAALDVEWGAVHRLRRDTLDLAANGASGDYGVFRVTGYRTAPDGSEVAASGDTFVAAIEFAEPVRAMGVLGYGNASQPGSPHRTDQLHLYASKRLRPIWRDRTSVEANLARREDL